MFFVILILNFCAMALRLVDGGIPSFEWKLKRFEIPFSEEELEELKRWDMVFIGLMVCYII